MELLHRPLVQAGYTIDFFTSDNVPLAARGRLGRFTFPWLVHRHAARAAVQGTPYDLINVHEPSSAVVTTFRRGLGKCALVVTTHGVERRAWELALEEGRLGRGGPSWTSRIWYPLTSLWQSGVGLTHADAVFCLNSEDQQYLTRRFGIAEARITRISPGADPLFAAASGARDYQSAKRLLFAGTWRKNKGIQDLVPAFTALAEQDTEVQVTVFGAGVPEAAVRAAFPAAIQPRVTTASTANDEETARVFATSDLFVLPSLFEGTPLTLMEAMMSGLPIVTTATCGMKDVVSDGVNGLLVPIRSSTRLVEAIQRLRVDPALRERLGRAAQAEAQARYTWDRVAEVVRKAYVRLLESGANRGSDYRADE